MNITFIGGGNMATALIGGMLSEGFTSQQINVVEINSENRTKLEKDFSVSTFADISKGIEKSQIIVLAVKPQQFREISKELAPLIRDQLLVSIAAGIRATDLARWSETDAIVRVMPNTPSLIRSGMSGLFALSAVSEEQRDQAQKIMAAVGETIWLQDEEMLDAVTGISGSGPAYVFYMIEALQRAALDMGFNAEESRRLAQSTFLGASKLAVASDDDVSVLRSRVTSKNGTTERALLSLDANRVAANIAEAAQAAQARSREMGQELGKG